MPSNIGSSSHTSTAVARSPSSASAATCRRHIRESSAKPCKNTSAGAFASRFGLGPAVISHAYSGPCACLVVLRGAVRRSMEKGAKTRFGVVAALALLYTAQGIPFGFATEYLPVVLREQGYSYAGIAALGWLQLPWQLKVFWAKAADHPRVRPHTRPLVLALQMALTATVACFAIRSVADAP